MKCYYIDDILVIDIFTNDKDIAIRKDILFYDDIDFNITYKRQRLYIKDNKYYVIQKNDMYKFFYVDNDYEVGIDYYKKSNEFRISEGIKNSDHGYKYIKWYPLRNKNYLLEEDYAIKLCYDTLKKFFIEFNISKRSCVNKFYNDFKQRIKKL